MTALLAIPEADEEAGFYIEPKGRSPASEFARQRAFLSYMARNAPAVDVLAIPNAGRGTDWERVRRWQEGARRGALDLVITWRPTRPDDRGVFFVEFKDKDGMPSPAQRDRLNWYARNGFGCGVYRTAERLVDHLRVAGAPFVA